MRSTCGVYVVWCHFVPESSTLFFLVLWSILWSSYQNVTDVTVWPIISNPNPRVLKIEKCKVIKNKIKWKNKLN